MAEQRRSGGTRASGLPSQAEVPSPLDEAGSAAASGSATSTRGPARPRTTPEPAFPWRDTATLATYRHLLLKGLRPDEAANLTAFLCGLHVGVGRWTLTEVNRLLFLRRLAQTGSWGVSDGASGRTH
jgi:hypothetical protein